MKKIVLICLALLVCLAGCASLGSKVKDGEKLHKPKEPAYNRIKPPKTDFGGRQVVRIGLKNFGSNPPPALMYEQGSCKIFFRVGAQEIERCGIKIPKKGEIFDANGNFVCEAEFYFCNEPGRFQVKEKCTGAIVTFNLSDGGKIMGPKTGHFNFWPVHTDKIVNQK